MCSQRVSLVDAGRPGSRSKRHTHRQAASVYGDDMIRRCLFAVLLVAILFSAPAGWAQGKFALKPKRTTASRPPAIRHYHPVSIRSFNQYVKHAVKPYHPSAVYIPKISEETLHTRIALLERVHQKRLKQAQEVPQFMGQPVSTPSAKLIYKGVELDELKQNERIIMGAAYDINKKMVSPMHSVLPNGEPVLLSQAEKSLMGYDIEVVMFVVKEAPVEGIPSHTRLIIYYPATQELTVDIH